MTATVSTRYVVGVDIGGTFTDSVIWGDNGELGVGKSFTTHDNLVEGLLAALHAGAETLALDRATLLERCSLLLHGTTVGTNALVERQGARVAMICTRGHRDVLPMMRAAGRVAGLPPEELLDAAAASKPDPLVPRSLVFEVDERTVADGSVLVELDESALDEIAGHIAREGCESVAVAFLWAHANPRNEQRCAELLRARLPGMQVSQSHEVAPRIGEYERFVATVINAYVGPRLVDYLSHLEGTLGEHGFRGRLLIMNCAGGVIGAKRAGTAAVQTINSGPAAGVLGCERLAQLRDESNVVTTDMGGTTFDVAIVSHGRPVRRSTSVANQHEYFVETLDVQSVGAGGGSIAWVDPVTGSLHVGPRSAGSMPGPVCYGRGGTEPTVTDADVVLGVINPENFLGGAERLDADAARRALSRLGEQLNMSEVELAAGICRIADAKMADLIRRLTVKRGLDPRTFAIYAYGGAGPLHVGAYGRDLGARTAVVPLGSLAPVWSAFGAAAANVTRAKFATLVLQEPFDGPRLTRAFDSLIADVETALVDEGFSGDKQRLERIVEVRYAAQIHTLDVELTSLSDGWEEELISRFEHIYEQTYGAGTGYREAGVEISAIKVIGTGLRELPPLPELTGSGQLDAETRDIHWYEIGAATETRIVQYDELPADLQLDGPLVIELPATSVVVRPGQSAARDRLGNIVIDLGNAGEQT